MALSRLSLKHTHTLARALSRFLRRAHALSRSLSHTHIHRQSVSQPSQPFRPPLAAEHAGTLEAPPRAHAPREDGGGGGGAEAGRARAGTVDVRRRQNVRREASLGRKQVGSSSSSRPFPPPRLRIASSGSSGKRTRPRREPSAWSNSDLEGTETSPHALTEAKEGQQRFALALCLRLTEIYNQFPDFHPSLALGPSACLSHHSPAELPPW
uniref:uncharacterized protein LOC114603256 n=1 Tax=Podarcis muralis TaxID=64176 RepID=UPI0010A027FA|nr:uncharacterized protein LOC114603256 [Podarcis muralis]